MLSKLSEKEVLRACLDILTAKKIFHWRNNSGALRTEKGGFVRFGAVGSPDIIAVLKGGFIVGIECKATGGKQSENQRNFEQELRKNGGMYWLVDSPESLLKRL